MQSAQEEAAAKAAKEAKESGNAAFACKEFGQAVECYGRAIAHTPADHKLWR